MEEEEDIEEDNDENEIAVEEENEPSKKMTNKEWSPQSITKSKKAKSCLVETEVRRSNRLKVRNKGFKTSSCGKVSCLGCSSKPPIIPNSVIRNLGSELCQIDPSQLSDELLSKKKDAGTIGPKKKKDIKDKKLKKKEDDKKN